MIEASSCFISMFWLNQSVQYFKMIKKRRRNTLMLVVKSVGSLCFS